jgi:hypothetical protein
MCTCHIPVPHPTSITMGLPEAILCSTIGVSSAGNNPPQKAVHIMCCTFKRWGTYIERWNKLLNCAVHQLYTHHSYKVIYRFPEIKVVNRNGELLNENYFTWSLSLILTKSRCGELGVGRGVRTRSQQNWWESLEEIPSKKFHRKSIGWYICWGHTHTKWWQAVNLLDTSRQQEAYCRVRTCRSDHTCHSTDDLGGKPSEITIRKDSYSLRKYWLTKMPAPHWAEGHSRRRRLILPSESTL